MALGLRHARRDVYAIQPVRGYAKAAAIRGPLRRRVAEPTRFYPQEILKSQGSTPRSKGTGLGLALVRGLVERMGAPVSGRKLPEGGFDRSRSRSVPPASAGRRHFRAGDEMPLLHPGGPPFTHVRVGPAVAAAHRRGRLAGTGGGDVDTDAAEPPEVVGEEWIPTVPGWNLAELPGTAARPGLGPTSAARTHGRVDAVSSLHRHAGLPRLAFGRVRSPIAAANGKALRVTLAAVERSTDAARRAAGVVVSLADGVRCALGGPLAGDPATRLGDAGDAAVARLEVGIVAVLARFDKPVAAFRDARGDEALSPLRAGPNDTS